MTGVITDCDDWGDWNYLREQYDALQQERPSRIVGCFIEVDCSLVRSGTSQALCARGVKHLFGDGVEQNARTALDLFKKASESNIHARSEFFAGLCYETGFDGIPVDRNKAFQHFNIAARFNYEPAKGKFKKD